MAAAAWRETIVRIAESPTLRRFIRLGDRAVMDFTFLNRAFKANEPDTWHKAIFRKYPHGVTADTGFRAEPETMAVVESHVETVAVPGRSRIDVPPRVASRITFPR